MTLFSYPRGNGFTLLELLLVMAVLMILGGTAVIAIDSLREPFVGQAAHIEMHQLRKALLQYRQDTGELPEGSAPFVRHPADFFFLYQQNNPAGWSPATQPSWNPNSGRGWRGPYLTSVGSGYVDVGDDLKSNGDGTPDAGNSVQVRGVADPFLARPLKASSGQPCEESPTNSPDLCLLDWRLTITAETLTRFGRPYLLLDAQDPARARLVSLGPDGVYAGVNTDNPCHPKGDDLVVCLVR